MLVTLNYVDIYNMYYYNTATTDGPRKEIYQGRDFKQLEKKEIDVLLTLRL